MLSKAVLLSLLNAGLLAEGSIIPRQNNRQGGGDNGGAQDSQLCLQADAIQDASASTGQDPNNPTDGQADSATDDANFINFCSGKTITNGLQITEGSCNGVVMGEIPATSNMVSANIIFPQHNDDIPALEDFDFQLQVANLEAGFFTNPQETYYSAPQQLNGQGNIIGHVHVTVQDLGGSLNPTDPLDPTRFVFFKGINDAGDGNGLLSATVTGGLPAGNYRVCTMSSAMNHQPVLMPVAQRGSQEDCQKFTVSEGGGNGGNADNGDDAEGDGANADGGDEEDNGNGGGGRGGGRGGNGGGNNQDNEVDQQAQDVPTETESADGVEETAEATETADADADVTETADVDAEATETVEATETEDIEATATEEAEVTETEDVEATATEDAEVTETEEAEVTETEEAEATQTEEAEATETEDAETTETAEPTETEDAAPTATEEGGVEPTDAVGGITPPAIEEEEVEDGTEEADEVIGEPEEEVEDNNNNGGGRKKHKVFNVGGKRFGSRRSAAREACAQQNRSCCNAARSGRGRREGFNTGTCGRQIGTCQAELGA